jgi:DEAD/DEAH box helicase domain-containing protein
VIFNLLHERNWTIVDESNKIPSREKKVVTYSDLAISEFTKKYLDLKVSGLYVHQKEAIRGLIQAKNICMVTGTASGKSLPFYAAAIEILSNNPSAKIVAIYPLKALGREQEKRWEESLRLAGIKGSVGRIDGDVSQQNRKIILKNCQIVIMTPDVIHAWLLSNAGERDVIKFIANVKLFIVDEVHTYTGVFGSNAAFLFRRIRHIMSLVNSKPQFLCASATMASPDKHLLNLFGLPFEIIGPDLDTSPKYEVKIIMLRPPEVGDYMTEVTYFLKQLGESSKLFLAFVDSRKQTELVTSILSRGQRDSDENLGEDFEESLITSGNEHLFSLNILPYRSGYEELDQLLIQKRLSEGSLRGVVSTSALELGLDIPNLDTVVLLGVPYSATSLWQRIGRVGRNCPGTVFVIHSGSVFDEVVFRNPKKLLQRPLSEGALYLQNPRIQYIHALCLSRENGEHDQFCAALGLPNEDNDFKSKIDWPDGFLALCKAERTGEIPVDLQAMKSEANDNPNHIYPLRDVESQFKVQFKQGPIIEDKGALSYSQVLREAYPGAVYYYATESFRVQKIMHRSRIIYVRKEKKYTTTPEKISKVFPNLTEGNVYNARLHNNLLVIEANCQVREAVFAFKEKRGSSQTKKFQYPLTGAGINVFFDLPRFNRNYFTSGVIFLHPCLNVEQNTLKVVAKILYEAFLISIPFERQDLDVSFGKLGVTRPPYINEGDCFVVIYDRTYGSLRLSGYVMAERKMSTIFNQALEIANSNEEVFESDGVLEITEEVINVLAILSSESNKNGSKIELESSAEKLPDDERYEKVIVPGGTGIAIKNNNMEYIVESVFFHPKQKELCYRGRYLNKNEGDSIWTVKDIKIVPGDSPVGYYDYETGEIIRK